MSEAVGGAQGNAAAKVGPVAFFDGGVFQRGDIDVVVDQWSWRSRQGSDCSEYQDSRCCPE